MYQLLKQLLVISVLASGVFFFARPIAEQFASKADVARRRNVWLLLTVVGFMSPSYWLYVLVAGVVLALASRKDDNPVALYFLLLHVLPPNAIPIPSPVELFELDNFRLLSLVVLLPLMIKLRRQSAAQVPHRALALPDYLLIGFGLLQTVLFVPPDLPGHVLLHDSATNMLRRGFLFFLDTFVLVYVVSRSCADRRKFMDACLYLMLGLTIMAAIGIFESARHWLLYDGVFSRWSTLITSSVYTIRGDSLRAEAAAGPSLVLGFCIAIAFGLWIALRPLMQTRLQRWGSLGLIWGGLLASYSRGPWLGALLMYVVFIVVSARTLGPILKGGVGIVAALTALMLSPAGDKVRAVLPMFGGTVDNFNVIYRKRLAARCWELILQSPFFGDQLAYTKMESLRQGEGIIDLVNTFAATALFYGLVGLALMLGFLLLPAAKALLRARRMLATDPQFAGFGFGLIATIAGALMMLYATSFFLGPEKLYFSLGALCAAFCYAREPAVVAAPAPAPRAAHVRLKPWAPR